MRSSGGSCAPFAATSASTGFACPFPRAAAADSELASTASHSSAWATGSQRVITSATTAATQVEHAGADPDGAGSHEVGQHARRRHRETDHGVVRAHDRRERASPVLIGRATLHEQAVADDDRPVARRSADDERDGEPDRAGQRSGAPPHAHEHERADVVATQPYLPEGGRAQEASDREPDTARRDERAESEVTGVEHVLRVEHLGDVDRACSRAAPRSTRSARCAAAAR